MVSIEVLFMALALFIVAGHSILISIFITNQRELYTPRQMDILDNWISFFLTVSTITILLGVLLIK